MLILGVASSACDLAEAFHLSVADDSGSRSRRNQSEGDYR